MTDAPASPDSSTSVRQRRAAVFGIVALGLALLIPLTWAIEAAVVARSGGDRAARVAQERTVGAVRARASSLVASMQREAVTVAALPEIRAALTAPEAAVSGDSGEALGALLARALPPFTSVEVYRPGLKLVAWNGDTFRLGVRATPDTLLSLAVPDPAERRARSLWRGSRAAPSGGCACPSRPLRR